VKPIAGEELVFKVGCASNPKELEVNKSAVKKLFFMRDCGLFFRRAPLQKLFQNNQRCVDGSEKH
jgi:hypothetical protein